MCYFSVENMNIHFMFPQIDSVQNVWYTLCTYNIILAILYHALLELPILLSNHGQYLFNHDDKLEHAISYHMGALSIKANALTEQG